MTCLRDVFELDNRQMRPIPASAPQATGGPASEFTDLNVNILIFMHHEQVLSLTGIDSSLE